MTVENPQNEAHVSSVRADSEFDIMRNQKLFCLQVVFDDGTDVSVHFSSSTTREGLARGLADFAKSIMAPAG